MRSSFLPPENRIPSDDWDRAPWNRWTFANVREMLPTVEVDRGAGPVWALPTRPVDLLHLNFTTRSGEPSTISHWLESSYTDGFIVLHRGDIVMEHYSGHMTERSLHLSQSVAKSITSAVAGVLVGQGLLDPERPVTDYLPELVQTAWKGAKLRHVLDMTTGVRFDEEYTSPDSDIAVTDVACGWKPPLPGRTYPTCIWEQILSMTESVRPHGAAFEYRSIETDVLAHCIERVTGRRLADVVSTELWQPLGAEKSACFTVDPVGYALADGGFNATLRDYARFGQMMIDDGVANGRRVVPADWIADTLDCQREPSAPAFSNLFPNGAYRNQFWIETAGKRVFMARGVFGQLIYMSPDDHLVVVKLSTWPEFVAEERSADALSAIAAISRTLNE